MKQFGSLFINSIKNLWLLSERMKKKLKQNFPILGKPSFNKIGFSYEDSNADVTEVTDQYFLFV